MLKLFRSSLCMVTTQELSASAIVKSRLARLSQVLFLAHVVAWCERFGVVVSGASVVAICRVARLSEHQGRGLRRPRFVPNFGGCRVWCPARRIGRQPGAEKEIWLGLTSS